MGNLGYLLQPYQISFVHQLTLIDIIQKINFPTLPINNIINSLRIMFT